MTVELPASLMAPMHDPRDPSCRLFASSTRLHLPAIDLASRCDPVVLASIA